MIYLQRINSDMTVSIFFSKDWTFKQAETYASTLKQPVAYNPLYIIFDTITLETKAFRL
jgi:hypothetical protein